MFGYKWGRSKSTVAIPSRTQAAVKDMTQPVPIKKKVCLLGAFAVGKTSLTQQFIHSIFSEKYLTTVGVRIDKKAVSLENNEVHLIIWDIEGEDDYARIRSSYLRGAAGYIVVADGMRSETIHRALDIHDSSQRMLGETPAVLAVNKSDLESEWAVSQSELSGIPSDIELIKTSAKTGNNVESLFTSLSQQIVDLGTANRPVR